MRQKMRHNTRRVRSKYIKHQQNQQNPQHNYFAKHRTVIPCLNRKSRKNDRFEIIRKNTIKGKDFA